MTDGRFKRDPVWLWYTAKGEDLFLLVVCCMFFVYAVCFCKRDMIFFVSVAPRRAPCAACLDLVPGRISN